jgi:hypothetical protein
VSLIFDLIVERCEITSDFISALLVDRELWKLIDNEKLLPLLFSKIEICLSAFEHFQLYLYHILVNNHMNLALILSILKFHFEHGHHFPQLFGCYIFELLGGPIQNPGALSCAQALIAVSKSFPLSEFLPTSTVLGLVTTAELELAVTLYHLFVTMLIHSPTSVAKDLNVLEYIVIRFSAIESVWLDTTRLMNKVDPSCLALLLTLIWCRTLATVYALATDQPPNDICDRETAAALSTCNHRISEVLASRDCIDVLINFYPLLLGLSYFVGNSENPSLEDGRMLVLVELVLAGFKYPDLRKTGFQTASVNHFIRPSPVFQFLARVLYQSSIPDFQRLFPPLILSVPFFERSFCATFSWSMILLLFSFEFDKFTCLQPFLSYLLWFVRSSLWTSAHHMKLLEKLLKLPESARKLIEFHRLFFSILTIMPLPDIRDFVRENIKLIVQLILDHKSEDAWLYHFANDSALSDFVTEGIRASRGLIARLRFASKPADREPAFKLQQAQIDAAVHDAGVELQIDLSEYDFLRISHTFLQMQKQAQSLFSANHSRFTNTTAELDLELAAAEAQTEWNLHGATQREAMTTIAKFHPERFILSPFCLPYEPPCRFIPSPFPRTRVMQVFQALTRCDFPKSRLTHLFRRFFGIAKGAMPSHGSILRLNPIKVVIFVQPSELLLLTHAQLHDGAIELIAYDDFEFAEAVLLGLWGRTALFLSHVVIRIPLADLIFVRRVDTHAFAFWTFSAGHFVIALDRDRAPAMRAIFQTQSDAATSELSNAPFLFRVADAQMALSRCAAGKLPIEDFLLTINALHGRTFADLRRFVYFPFNLASREFTTRFPNGKETAFLLRQIHPFSYNPLLPESQLGRDDDSDGSGSSGSPTFSDPADEESLSEIVPPPFRQRARSEAVEPRVSIEKLSAVLPSWVCFCQTAPPDSPAVL